jgi:hypothetical protein
MIKWGYFINEADVNMTRSRIMWNMWLIRTLDTGDTHGITLTCLTVTLYLALSGIDWFVLRYPFQRFIEVAETGWAYDASTPAWRKHDYCLIIRHWQTRVTCLAINGATIDVVAMLVRLCTGHRLPGFCCYLEQPFDNAYKLYLSSHLCLVISLFRQGFRKAIL